MEFYKAVLQSCATIKKSNTFHYFQIMAFRAKIFHIVILGLVGIIVIFYSSFFNGPVLVYHIETDQHGKSQFSSSRISFCIKLLFFPISLSHSAACLSFCVHLLQLRSCCHDFTSSLLAERFGYIFEFLISGSRVMN